MPAYNIFIYLQYIRFFDSLAMYDAHISSQKSKSLPKTKTSKKFDFDFIIQYLKKQIIKKSFSFSSNMPVKWQCQFSMNYNIAIV